MGNTNGCCKHGQTDVKSEVKFDNQKLVEDRLIQQRAEAGSPGSYYQFTPNTRNPLQGKYVYDPQQNPRVIGIDSPTYNGAEYYLPAPYSAREPAKVVQTTTLASPSVTNSSIPKPIFTTSTVVSGVSGVSVRQPSNPLMNGLRTPAN